MKVGLLTVHCSTNPGASLQAYALSKVLGRIGTDTILIDYRPEYFTSEFDSGKRRRCNQSVKKCIGCFLFGHRRKIEYNQYIDFENKYLPLKTRRYDCLDGLYECVPDCDVFLCGSDQIWNPQHTHYDPVMELSFAKCSGKPCYSYAASIGQDELTEKDINFLKNNLSGFRMISVREESAKEIIQNKLGIVGVERNVDPTLLLSRSEWEEIESAIHERVKGKYILFYPLAENPLAFPLLKKLKKKLGLPVISLSRRIQKDSAVDKQYRTFSPNDFIDLIHHSEYVVTNSFHGCVFSLIFERKLISYKNTERNTRMECLFQMFGIDDAQITRLDELDYQDFQKRIERIKLDHAILNKEQSNAIVYLERMMKNEC